MSIENDIADIFVPRTGRLSLPDYVAHREGVNAVGQLSAEAMVREYELAAKEIEAMGAQLVERAHQCEAMMRDLYAVVEELKDTAAKYRGKAKLTFDHIEACSIMASEVRQTCAVLREKIANTNVIEASHAVKT